MKILLIIMGIIATIFIIGLYKFSKRMNDIEDKNAIFITGDDVGSYTAYLLCKIEEIHPNISDKDKIKVVIEVLRDAAKKNGSYNFLATVDSNYRIIFEDTLFDLQQIKQVSFEDRIKIIQDYHSRQFNILKKGKDNFLQEVIVERAAFI